MNKGRVIERHGYYHHPIYSVWESMKKRCYNPNDIGYHNYGGRGITVCDKWRGSAKTFIEWCLENGYKKGLTIDRIDNDGNYSPQNCRFITLKENIHNGRLLRNTNTSGYRGVSYYLKTKKWGSHIRINGSLKHLGCFDSPRLAAIRYDVEAYLTDNRPRNFIH